MSKGGIVRSRQKYEKLLPLALLMTVLFMLAACQQAEDVDRAASTLEAELIMTVRPEPSPNDKSNPADVPDEEPTRQVVPTGQPTATELPAPSESDMEEYVSPTEFFSLMVPAGWSSEETLPGAAFVMANSEEALARFREGGAAEPGDFVMNVGFIPYRLLQTNELRNLDFAYEASPDIFLQSLLPMFRLTGEADMSDVELASLGGKIEAGKVKVSDAGREGTVLMFPAGESVIALISTVGFPGEIGEYQEMTYAIAAEVAFSGAQDTLYGILLGG
jgi:hypothetical protein